MDQECFSTSLLRKDRISDLKVCGNAHLITGVTSDNGAF